MEGGTGGHIPPNFLEGGENPPKCAKKCDRVKDILKDGYIFLMVDEAFVNDASYLHILAGKISMPQICYMILCCQLEEVPNESIIVQKIEDALRDIECQRSKLILILSDCAPYMQAAGKTVKQLCPCLLYTSPSPRD